MIGRFHALAVLCLAAGILPATGTDILQRFIEAKETQYRDMAASRGLVVPGQVEQFFEAAKSGDTNATTSLFHVLDRPQRTTDFLFPILHETYGASVVFALWKPGLLDKYAGDLMASIPDNAVFFGGTAPGRFVVTAYSEVLGRSNVLVVTQNGLSNERYMEYLRETVGNAMTIPSQENCVSAAEQLISAAQAGQIPPTPGLSIEDGLPKIVGPSAGMAYQGLIARLIFEGNKSKRDFYYEESFVIPWMYPYLEPHGLIMKLNREPTPLDAAVIEEDRKYWAALVDALTSRPEFAECEEARNVFAKLRSGIGGMYEFRRNLSEAEYAYRQCVELCPECPEGNFRLSDHYLRQFKFEDALELMHAFRGHSADPARIDEYILQIEKNSKLDVRRRELEPQSNEGANVEPSLELLSVYNEMGLRYQFDKLVDALLKKEDLPQSAVEAMARMCKEFTRPDLYEMVIAKRPTDRVR